MQRAWSPIDIEFSAAGPGSQNSARILGPGAPSLGASPGEGPRGGEGALPGGKGGKGNGGKHVRHTASVRSRDIATCNRWPPLYQPYMHVTARFLPRRNKSINQPTNPKLLVHAAPPGAVPAAGKGKGGDAGKGGGKGAGPPGAPPGKGGKGGPPPPGAGAPAAATRARPALLRAFARYPRRKRNNARRFPGHGHGV